MPVLANGHSRFNTVTGWRLQLIHDLGTEGLEAGHVAVGDQASHGSLDVEPGFPLKELADARFLENQVRPGRRLRMSDRADGLQDPGLDSLLVRLEDLRVHLQGLSRVQVDHDGQALSLDDGVELLEHVPHAPAQRLDQPLVQMIPDDEGRGADHEDQPEKR